MPGLNVTTDEDIKKFITATPMTVYHVSYTCKMGKVNDTMAVIDSKARVIGVDRLRVVHASSFPFLVPGHPPSTICGLTWSLPFLKKANIITDALAEKISDGMLNSYE